MNNPYAAYKQQSISTMTNVEIVIKLYDETEKHLNRAGYFIEQRDLAGAHSAFTRANELISALRSVLDMNIEMSKNLDSLYEYFSVQIIQADARKDTRIISTILPQIAEFKDAFVQISKMPKL